MKVGTPKETAPDERRVALVPDTVSRLAAATLEVKVESGAGSEAFITDQAYEQAGAKIVKGPAALIGDADAVLKVQAPVEAEIEAFPERFPAASYASTASV